MVVWWLCAGYWPLTSDLTVHYLRPSGRASLHAVARIIRSSARADVVQGWVYDATDVNDAHAAADASGHTGSSSGSSSNMRKPLVHAVATFTLPPASNPAARSAITKSAVAGTAGAAVAALRTGTGTGQLAPIAAKL